MGRPRPRRVEGFARARPPIHGFRSCSFAQAGVKPDNVKPLRGFKGAGVLEVVEDYDGDTYRTAYTVKLAGVVYVLHCFQKKSKK